MSASARQTLQQLCSLFCCPPCPEQIAAKLAFLPPDPPTYSISQIDPGGRAYAQAPGAADGKLYSLHLTERAEWQFGEAELEVIEVTLPRTERGNNIVCMYFKCFPDARDAPDAPSARQARSKYTILFCHGNAVDLGQMSSFMIALSKHTGCNVFTFDYSGYGMSSGRPRERELYADVRCAWHVLRTRYGLLGREIILYGQSIGSVAAIDLAAHLSQPARARNGLDGGLASDAEGPAGVVLHSALASGLRVACKTERTWCCDPFPNIEKVPSIAAPTLVIHGRQDEVIHVSHGYALFERLPNKVDPLWVDGAGHNDVELHAVYLERLRTFIDVELPAYWSVRTPEPPRAANGTALPDSGNGELVTRQPLSNAGYANAALGASLDGSLAAVSAAASASASGPSYEQRGKRGSTTSSIKSTRSNESAATTGTTSPLVRGTS